MWSARLRSLIVVFTIVTCFTFFGPTGHAQNSIDEENGCQTPDQEAGNCIPISQCSSILDVVRILKRPISPVILQKLQTYNCGFAVNEIKVCCPSKPIILESNKIPSQIQEDRSLNFLNHRNLNLLPKDCGRVENVDKIINGIDADLNEFPWMTLLRYKGGRGLSFDCGGTIINKNYILTAAHCITDLDPSSKLASVRVGEYSISNQSDCVTIKGNIKCNPPTQDLKIEEIIPHPEFVGKSFVNDIGLLRVSTIDLSVVNAVPICLPLGNKKTYKSVTVTGWGVTDWATRKKSDILQKVILPVANKESCKNSYDVYNIKIGKAQICAGGVNEKDTCPGDSGGPMMVAANDESGVSRYYQEGIISFGPQYCGIMGYPSVYVLIEYYMNWILDTIKP